MLILQIPTSLIVTLFILLIFIGVGLLILACKLGKHIFENKAIVELPFSQKSTTFSIPQTGKYGIWHKGKQMMYAPVDKYRPLVTDTDTGKTIALNKHLLRTRQTSMSGIASVMLFSFKAKAGTYKLELVDGTSISAIEKAISQPLAPLFAKFNPDRYFIVVKKYQSPLLIFALVWSILLGIASIVCGLIFSINAERIFG